MINMNQMKASIYQKNASNTKEQRQIQLERIKADELKAKRQQLEANLLLLKHNDRECMNLVNRISLNPEYQASSQLVNNKAHSIVQALDRYQTVKITNFNSEISNLQIEKDLQQQRNNLLNVGQALRSLELVHQSLISKLAFYQKEYQEIRDKVSTINEQLHKRERVEELSDRVASLIEQFNTQLPNQLSQQDIQLLQKFDFNSLNLSSNEEIIHRKQKIQSLKYDLLEMNLKYSIIQNQLKGRQQVQKDLYKNETLNRKLNQQLNEITTYNDSLETNMTHEVKRIVQQKIQSINFDSYKHVKKYTQATEYLLHIFGKILEKQQFDETINQIQALKQSAKKKYELRP